MKIFVTGLKGMVGSRFAELNKDLELATADLPEFDLADRQTVKETLEQVKPDWIVNMAAFTDVNAAEQQAGDESGPAWKANVVGVENLVNSFDPKKIIQISTDMVFPGTEDFPGPYKEKDTPPETGEKLTWYGWTKNRGEKIARESGATVVRIIYPVLVDALKLDYIRGPLKRFAEGKMYPMFNDQQVSISFVDEISQVIRKIIDKNLNGIFHVSTNTTTPFELIEYTLRKLGKDTSGLKQSSVKEFLKTQANPSRYPVYGGLSTEMTEEKLEIKFSSWQAVVDKLIEQGLKMPEVL